MDRVALPARFSLNTAQCPARPGTHRARRSHPAQAQQSASNDPNKITHALAHTYTQPQAGRGSCRECRDRAVSAGRRAAPPPRLACTRGTCRRGGGCSGTPWARCSAASAAPPRPALCRGERRTADVEFFSTDRAVRRPVKAGPRHAMDYGHPDSEGHNLSCT